MKKLLTFSILFLFLFNLSLCEAYQFKPAIINKEYTLVVGCSSCTYSNITISNVNGIIINGAGMTNLGSDLWSYIYTPQILGRHDISINRDEYGFEETYTAYFDVEATSSLNTLPKALLAIFFMLLLTILTIYSHKLTKNKRELNLKEIAMYKDKNIIEYYTKIMSRNVFIFGWFGMYLSITAIVAILNVCLYSMNLLEFANITTYAIILLGWGMIPFTIYWLLWSVVFIYKTNEKILSYQLGGFMRERR